MPQPKGKTGNPNGRPKGIQNKSTPEIKEAIKAIVENNFTRLASDLDKMSPFMRWTILDKVMRYAYPTFSQQKLEGDLNHNIEIKVSFSPINNQVVELEAPEPKSIEDSTSIDFVDLQKDLVTGFTTKSEENIADQLGKEGKDSG